jgi:hypothetical protein
MILPFQTGYFNRGDEKFPRGLFVPPRLHLIDDYFCFGIKDGIKEQPIPIA